ncbi:MAG: peptidylprolyl isomerase [Planctomycetota bacterium]|nr:MAG: peptidylprolyl isomerase [Planctomycetota bacterium]
MRIKDDAMTEPVSSVVPPRPIPTHRRSPLRTLLMLVGGTASILAVAGVSFQLLHVDHGSNPQPASAAETRSSSTSPATQRKPWGGYAARVTHNGRQALISMEDLARECILRVGPEVLDNIINRTLIQLACEQRGIVVTQEEVDQEIVRIAKQFDLTVDNWLKMLKAQRDITPEEYRRDVIWPMLALKKLTGKTVTVTEDELQRAFYRHYGPRVKAKMIMLDNIRRANDIWQKVTRNPESFERLAREYSIEPNSRALDGQIPPIPMFSGNDKLEEAAFKLRPGEISGIIQLGVNQYVILKCEGRTEQIVKSIDEPGIREELTEELRRQKTQELIAKTFDSIKKQARIDNYLTGVTTGPVTQTSGEGAGAGHVRQPGATSPPTARRR